MVPMPFTRKQLEYLIRHTSGFEDDEESVQRYTDRVITDGVVSLNPSDATGFGADIVDIFSMGLMAMAKTDDWPELDLSHFWFHPCRNTLRKIISVETEAIAIEVNSIENVMYYAMDAASGQMVSADEAGRLKSYKSPEDGKSVSPGESPGVGEEGEEVTHG